jgi:hypothetical protein
MRIGRDSPLRRKAVNNLLKRFHCDLLTLKDEHQDFLSARLIVQINVMLHQEKKKT